VAAESTKLRDNKGNETDVGPVKSVDKFLFCQVLNSCCVDGFDTCLARLGITGRLVLPLWYAFMFLGLRFFPLFLFLLLFLVRIVDIPECPK
jgi:hypothetical protein